MKILQILGFCTEYLSRSDKILSCNSCGSSKIPLYGWNSGWDGALEGVVMIKCNIHMRGRGGIISHSTHRLAIGDLECPCVCS